MLSCFLDFSRYLTENTDGLHVTSVLFVCDIN